MKSSAFESAWSTCKSYESRALFPGRGNRQVQEVIGMDDTRCSVGDPSCQLPSASASLCYMEAMHVIPYIVPVAVTYDRELAAFTLLEKTLR